MAGALWFVGALIFVIYFGTLALQVLLWLLQLALFVARALLIAVAGIVGFLALAVLDRRQLERIIRDTSSRGSVTRTIIPGRWV